MIDITNALASLTPNAQWVLRGDELEWLDRVQSQPTDEEIQTEIARLTYLESINQYQRDRQYPPMNEQLDNIFHNGVDAWKADIQAIKDAVPKVLPDSADQALAISTHVNSWRFVQQVEAYTKSMSRLSQYQVALGREEVTEETVVGTRPVLDENNETVLGSEGQVTHEDIVEDIVVVTSIDPVDATIEQTTHDEDGVSTTTTVENPLIIQDNAERAEAQAVVDATPQSVIDTYNE